MLAITTVKYTLGLVTMLWDELLVYDTHSDTRDHLVNVACQTAIARISSRLC